MGVDDQLHRDLDPRVDLMRLVYDDHRGNGRSAGPADTRTMQQWAADAAGLARAVAGDEPVIAIGHSFGGSVAQELALAHPGAVGALVLVATTPGLLGTSEGPAPEGPPMPEECAALLGTMPETDGDLAVFEHSAHLPWLDEPERCFAVVVDWLVRRGLVAPPQP